MTPTAILGELASHGVHSTDATDALDAADLEWVRGGNQPSPTWLELNDAEVQERRALT
jgi:hypothetical protein